jgi:hypothetical protein
MDYLDATAWRLDMPDYPDEAPPPFLPPDIDEQAQKNAERFDPYSAW